MKIASLRRNADFRVCRIAAFPTCASGADCTVCQLESRRYGRLESLRHLSCYIALVLVLAIKSVMASIPTEQVTADTLARISFDQKLNAQISSDLEFRDEQGNSVRLGNYFGRKPHILVFGYYKCPMLCSLVLNGMVESLEDLKWSIGAEFDVIQVSINPRETPALAAAKKATYLKRYGRSGAAEGWHFLTGAEQTIQKVTAEAGFIYAYDSASGEYAHPSGLIILTPEGKISSYDFGVTFDARRLNSQLQTAAGRQIGSPLQKLLLVCFHYNPITGKYGSLILWILRGLGILTVAAVAALMLTQANRATLGRRAAAAPEEEPSA
jgi:protein SCO1